MVKTIVTDELANWPDIRDTYRKDDVGLLLGNGSSQAIWNNFSYESLYGVACDPSREHHLAKEEQTLFAQMETSNFEHVLWALATTKMVCTLLSKPHEDVAAHYEAIRFSLIHAVKDIHVPFASVTDAIKDRLRLIFAQYDYVYTTNYDMLLYWVVMNAERDFKDFLWFKRFDPSDAHVWGDVTKILFLHGALHLYHDIAGQTVKKSHDEDYGNILGQFYSDPNLIPLFVSEGDWKDKLRSIRRNDYLSFAYWKLAFHRGPMVVFGHSLAEQFDKHILDAMVNWKRYDQGRYKGTAPRRQVAIAMYPKTPSSRIVAEKNRLSSVLSECDVRFFDSTTHPLGHASLQVTAST
jgi:hypothetical protein